MPNHDLSWMQAAPSLSVTNAEGLRQPANTPFGHRSVEVDRVYEEIDYLPSRPHLGGMYVYADLVYPALQLGFSLFELYHAEIGKNLKPKLYLTPQAMVSVLNTNFEDSKNAHRLIWISDDLEAMRFIDFITSYVFTRREKHEARSVRAAVLDVRYPSSDEVLRKVSCTYLIPYSTKGGYAHDVAASSLSPYPVFGWQPRAVHAESQALALQAEALWQSC